MMMKYEAIIRVTVNDVILCAKRPMKASHITRVLEYIEEKHDCNLTFWENVENAINKTKIKV